VNGSWHNGELAGRAVEIAAQSMVTDTVASFAGRAIDVVGYQMAGRAARGRLRPISVSARMTSRSSRCTTVSPATNCFAYEALGTVPARRGWPVDRTAVRSATAENGVVNRRADCSPGGTHWARRAWRKCIELTSQLRAEAGDRQVAGAAVALQHNNASAEMSS